jgi:hypothetical protein
VEDTHECPAPGCEKRVPQHMLACRRHYHELPKVLRGKLYQAWDGGLGYGSEEHREAIRECRAFWETNAA